MNKPDEPSCTAFQGNRRIASGTLTEIARASKLAIDRDPTARILAFDDASSRPVELDLRGSMQDVLERVASANPTGETSTESDVASINEAPRGPGRPKLGVVAREVTLLPRHWSWLNLQPGGASVALRKLVEEARRANAAGDRVRHAQETAYRFMSAMAGDAPAFEAATRALFAGDAVLFERAIANWTVDLREYARKLATPAFPSSNPDE